MPLTEELLWRFIFLLDAEIPMGFVKLRTGWEMNKSIFLFKMEQPYYAADYSIHLNTDVTKLT